MNPRTSPNTKSIQRLGFDTVHGLVTGSALLALRDSLDPAFAPALSRGLLATIPAVLDLAWRGPAHETAAEVLGPAARPVRALLFDKRSGANWIVPWHQDLTIRVRRRVDVAGFGPWSIKEGIQHVQPPVEILAAMIAVRVHLDACPVDNGALRVLPATHLLGRLDDAGIRRASAEVEPLVVEADAGDAILMRPLLVHSSPAAVRPANRRVVHIEYSAAPLPGGLEWLDVEPPPTA